LLTAPRSSYDDSETDIWNISATPQQLIDTYPTLDPRVRSLFQNATDIKRWPLYVHKPYPYWTQGIVALLGDAAHPMLPDQAQGFGQAIEDAAALGVLFGEFWDGDVKRALKRYEEVRKERATRIQDASARARKDLSERIGWRVGDEREGKLTIEEVCGYDLAEHVRRVVTSEA
jgi:salicylate hydroxylase